MSLDAALKAAFAAHPERMAISFEGRTYSWRWLSETAVRVNELLDQAGVAADTPVGLIPRNCPTSIAALMALCMAPRSITMIYAFQSPEAMAADIGKLNLAAIVGEARDWSEPAIAAARAAGTVAVRLGQPGEPTVATVPGLERSQGGPYRAPIIPPGIELLTSGTTGPPKRLPMGYEVIYRSLVAESTVSRPSQNAPTPALVYYPFGNISGLYNLLPMMASATPVILLEKFDLEAWRDYVRTYRPRRIGLPPSFVQMLLDANPPAEELASLEAVNSGAARLDPLVQEEFEERYGIPMLLAYGATEFGGPVSNMTLDDARAFGKAKRGSVGRPWAGAALRIINPETEEVLGPGEEGLLEVRTPRMGDHWIRTTDVAMIDEDGFLWHRGRADGAIVRGGFKILPEVVASALRTHPSVGTAVVVGMPDRRLGEVPVAAVELRPGAPAPTEEELAQHIRRTLYATHVPTRFLITENLPRTPSLKISMPGVRALFETAPAAPGTRS